MNKLDAISVILKLEHENVLNSKKLLDLKELIREAKEIDTKGKPYSKDSKSYDKRN